MCFFIVKYLHAFVWSYNVLLRIWNMTQSESLRIKRTVTLFLLEVGYNEKIAQFLTIECLKKFFCKAGNRDYSNGLSNMPWWEGLIIHVNKNTCLPACIENDFRADADNPPAKKQVNRFRSILTGSSQPGPTGSLAIWFSSSQILTAAQGRSPWCCIPLTG